MKKTVTVLALAFCMAIPVANASNSENLPESVSTIAPAPKVSAICEAALKGDVQKVKMLIDNGVDINVKSNGMLPIHYAARYNRVEVIKALITAGSKIHATCDKGYTALRHAERTNAKPGEHPGREEGLWPPSPSCSARCPGFF